MVLWCHSHIQLKLIEVEVDFILLRQTDLRINLTLFLRRLGPHMVIFELQWSFFVSVSMFSCFLVTFGAIFCHIGLFLVNFKVQKICSMCSNNFHFSSFFVFWIFDFMQRLSKTVSVLSNTGKITSICKIIQSRD